MTELWRGPERAEFVAQSLETGDHWDVPSSKLRTAVGLGMLVAGIFRPRARQVLAREVFIVNNPVAHGLRLAQAIAECLDDGDVLADAALAAEQLPITRSISSLGVRSIGRVSTFRRLMTALREWRGLDRFTRRRIGRTGVEALYLFLAQSMRLADAEEALGDPASRAQVLITDFDRAAFAAPWVEAARRRGLPTVTLLHGSPQAATYLPLRASIAFTWGEVQDEWFRARAPEIRSFTVGRPDLAEGDAADDGTSPRLFICHSRESLSSGESNRLRALAQRAADTYQLVLRVHPSVPLTGLGAEWNAIAAVCHRIEHGSSPLPLVLRAADVVAVVSSTAAVDALAQLVRPIVLADHDRELPADLAALVTAEPFSEQVLSHGDSRSDLRELRDRIIICRGDRARARVRNALHDIVTDSLV